MHMRCTYPEIVRCVFVLSNGTAFRRIAVLRGTNVNFLPKPHAEVFDSNHVAEGPLVGDVILEAEIVAHQLDEFGHEPHPRISIWLVPSQNVRDREHDDLNADAGRFPGICERRIPYASAPKVVS